MKKLAFAGAVIVALTFAAEASAGGWAGSRYDKSECTYNKDTNTLFCQTTFTERVDNVTATVFVSDASCASGTRVIQRTGTQVQTWVGFGTFTGHVPVPKHELFGNEFPVGDPTWENFTDVDQGCLV